MSQVNDIAARPTSAEDAVQDAQPTSPGGLIVGSKPEATDTTPSPTFSTHKYGSPYEATLNSVNGREAMGSPGLESIQHMETEKEIYRPEPQYPPSYKYGNVDDRREQPRKRKKRICGVPLIWLLALALLLAALAVGLGAGLGVGLQGGGGDGTSESDQSNNSAGQPPTPRPVDPNAPASEFSTSGTFNGTGMALATQSFGQDNYGTVVVYFQHWTGQIRWLQLGTDGAWDGGGETNIVATDARNGTPIAAVAYSMNGASAWHIFYIDVDNILQETINGNTTNNWEVGPLGDAKLKAMDDPNVALQGCWEGYRPGGQINAVPIRGTGENYTDTSQTQGINLWYGSDPTTLQSVGWTFGTSTWSKGESLTGYNAHAGVGCYSWGPGTVTYLMASDLSDTVNILWKDLSQNATRTSSHPVGEWTNSSVAIPNSFQNTSLGYTEFLYAQDAALNVVGYNVSWNAEATTFVTADSFTIDGDVGIPGTHMTVTATPGDSGGQDLLVFNQNNGSSITEYVRDLYAGQWTSRPLPIPNE